MTHEEHHQEQIQEQSQEYHEALLQHVPHELSEPNLLIQENSQDQ